MSDRGAQQGEKERKRRSEHFGKSSADASHTGALHGKSSLPTGFPIWAHLLAILIPGGLQALGPACEAKDVRTSAWAGVRARPLARAERPLSHGSPR